MRYGYKLSAEGFDPKELIRQAKLAEASGFDFVEMSDHFHPWLDSQGHSPFAWTVLGAIAAETDPAFLYWLARHPSGTRYRAEIARVLAEKRAPVDY